MQIPYAAPGPVKGPAYELWLAYRLRWKRRRFLYRAWRKRHQLKPVTNNMHRRNTDVILTFTTIRNEVERLPHFLKHYRNLGVGHFLIVDNNSTDGSREFLTKQPDISLWTTEHSYKKSRFGVDWLTWLQIKYGHNHWCLTVDADELLIYPHSDEKPLQELTKWLYTNDQHAFGTITIDLYPKGKIGDVPYTPSDNPVTNLPYFDAAGYWCQHQPTYANLWIQGGMRARKFFATDPKRAPTLNKIPLIYWNRRYAYVTSTHHALPRRLNNAFPIPHGSMPTGALLHTKFLNSIVSKSAEEQRRAEHFENSTLYDDYYQKLTKNPDLWDETATRYEGWEQLVRLGLMAKGDWAV